MKEIITSKQNATIKEIRKLLNKKERDRNQQFLVEGIHMIQEAYKAKCLKHIFLLEDIECPYPVDMTYCSQGVLNTLSVQTSDAKIIGLCDFPNVASSSNRILLLDGIQDPGNMGTLIRTAHSFGFNTILCSNQCVDIYNPKTIQSSQGALFYTNVQRVNLKEEILHLQNQGFIVYSTALHHNSKPLSTIVPNESYALVLGNEGSGVSEDILSICDQSIVVEMESFESLNVGIAGGIAMYTLKQKEANVS